jgi:hypothetical protein
MKSLKCTLPAPTETVSWPRGSFKFDNVTVQFDGFERAAHCDDAGTFLLVEEKVVHLPDLLNSDQPPFWRFGTAENTVYYRLNITQLGDLDLNFVVGGHGYVVGKEDIAFVKKYLDSMDAAVEEAMKTIQFGSGVKDLGKVNNHAELMVPWVASLGAKVAEILRPEYGQYYGFDFLFRLTQRWWQCLPYCIPEQPSQSSLLQRPSVNSSLDQYNTSLGY